MKKITVVEDNPDNRLLVRVILEPFYEVTDYETGFAALAGLQSQPPDAVLLDISLPEMDGAEVLRRIRANAQLKHLPVIALTAHAMSGDREKYLQAGFDDYVSKPIVDEAILLDAIQRQLSGSPSATAAVATAPGELEVALERLHRLGGGKFVREMIDLFLDYAGSKIAEARRAQMAGDSAGVARAAHPLKSSAGNVGATRVQELAAQIELSAEKKTSGELYRLVGELETAFAEFKPKLAAGKKMFGNEKT